MHHHGFLTSSTHHFGLVCLQSVATAAPSYGCIQTRARKPTSINKISIKKSEPSSKTAVVHLYLPKLYFLVFSHNYTNALLGLHGGSHNRSSSEDMRTPLVAIIISCSAAVNQSYPVTITFILQEHERIRIQPPTSQPER